jgi:hypothetical protein
MSVAWVQEKIRQHDVEEHPVCAILEVEIQLIGRPGVADIANQNILRRTTLDTIHQGLGNLTLHLTEPVIRTINIPWETYNRDSTRFVTRTTFADHLLKQSVTQFFQAFDENRNVRVHYTLSKPFEP